MQVMAVTISLSAGTDDEYTFWKLSPVILGIPETSPRSPWDEGPEWEFVESP